MIYKIKLFLQILLKNRNRPAFWHLLPLVFKSRYQAFTAKLFGRKIQVPDSASYVFMCREIFEREIYRFPSDEKQPVIIDGGANIGLSVIFFKKLYPHAQITAFEPDSQIFEILKYNLQQFDFKDIFLEKKALWKTDTTLQFESEGADGGRIDTQPKGNLVEVSAVSLRPYLTKEIDFLKLDIEGAETKVLESCQNLLKNVKNIFIEYHSFEQQPQTLAQILEILKSNGFRYYVENNGVTSDKPFQAIRTASGMDMQINIFGYRHSSSESN